MKPGLASDLQTSTLAALYDRRYEGGYMTDDPFTRWSHAGVELVRVKETLSRIPPEAIRSILDYGCGSGAWTGTLAGAFPGARIAGIEISAAAIAKAEAAWPKHAFRTFDGIAAPFPSGAFDLVFSYHVLEHVEDLGTVAADMARLIAPDGWLCVIFPCGNPGSFEQRLAARLEGGIEIGPHGSTRFFFEDPTHLRRLPSAAVIQLFERRGLALRGQAFAHQLFGAIEWISASGRSFVRELFSSRRPVGPAAGAATRATGTLVWTLALLRDIGRSRPGAQAGAGRRVVHHALLPARILGGMTGRALERLALMEWRRRRNHPNGSAQFLVFQRPAAR